MTGFRREAGELRCDGTSLEEASRRFGTPLYVYSAATVTESYSTYAKAFASVPHRICYAMKANGNTELLRILCGLGAGVDIVSGFEMLRPRFARASPRSASCSREWGRPRPSWSSGSGRGSATSTSRARRSSSA